MDGRKINLIKSLQFRLGVALTVLMVTAAILIGMIAYRSTLHDAHELQDDFLVDIANMVNADKVTISRADKENLDDLEDPDSHVVIQITSPDKTENQTAALFPGNLGKGMHNVRSDDDEWRVHVRELDDGRKILVGQRLEVRNELARHAGNRTIFRILLVIPLLLLLQIFIVRMMLKPLRRLAFDMNQRNADDLRELAYDDLPSEFRPTLESMSGMLSRISGVFDAQRRFVADAAHELRSPLTALTLQAQNLLSQDLSVEARNRLEEFGRGLRRANSLVDQLLSMARTQQSKSAPSTSVSMHQVIRHVIEALMPLADSFNTEIGLRPCDDIEVQANADDLNTMIRNLLDNAIRYSGKNASIEIQLAVENNLVTISVQDNGPGIPADQHEKIFDAFHRVPGNEQIGSGLGLAIVKEIALKMKGQVSVLSDVTHAGARITVRFPAT